MQRITTEIKKVFTLDLRSLSLLRIGIGLVLLLDLAIRATDLKAFYSDEGVLPLKTLFLHNWNLWNISVHTISGLWQIQALLFIVAAFFSFLLLVGYKTTLSSLICWFLLFSLHTRNPLILQGGDDLLRMMLFWGIFLPWGKFYSVDAYYKPEPLEKQVFSVATIGYVLQILSVYFFAALLKTSSEWTNEGTAIYYALSIDQMVLPLGKLIYPFPVILKWMTHLVWHLELLVPFLFLIPYKNAFFRKTGIILLILLHTGISVSLFVGLFFLIGIVTLFGMIPSDWIEKFDKIASPVKIMLYNLYGFWIDYKNKFFKFEFNIKTLWKSSNKWIYRIGNATLSVFIAYTLLWNFHTTRYSFINLNNYNTDFIGQLFKIKQKWGMFSPGVFKEDGWFILEATTYDGNVIDIYRNGNQVNYLKPENIVSLYKNDRWRKFGENSIFKSNSYIRPLYCQFMFKKWNEANPHNKIKDLKLIYMMEKTLPDYQYIKPTKKELAFISE
ncbi:MAG: HTTM domain-containing protein [Bacteroidota bacterium]|nr:HTTM domain-containing protein [Bacteroidota bacterium]